VLCPPNRSLTSTVLCDEGCECSPKRQAGKKRDSEQDTVAWQIIMIIYIYRVSKT